MTQSGQRAIIATLEARAVNGRLRKYNADGWRLDQILKHPFVLHVQASAGALIRGVVLGISMRSHVPAFALR
jgi:hypothetical protein